MQDRFLRGLVIAKILRWSTRTLLVLLLSIVTAIAAFRLAAGLRETGVRAELAPSTGHLVPTSSGGLFVQEKGPAGGVPVVLFHGSVAWSEFWRRTIDTLAAAGFHVIALDIPPFGFSDRPGNYARSDQAVRVDDVLRNLQADRAIIVGHSFGSGAATEFVMRYPQSARALVLIDPALGLMSPSPDLPFLLRPKWIREILVSLTLTNPLATKPLLQSMIAKKQRALPEYIEILWRPWVLRGSTPDFADWAQGFLGSENNALSADRQSYQHVKIPVALLWGDEDTVTPLEQAHDLQTLLPQATLTVLPGLGHIPQIEDPDAFHDALLKALGKL
jgi:pimeloyl-ACP methyl ester carboxylesterase